MASRKRARSVWAWAALGPGGLALAGLGALLLINAWAGYLAANPGFHGEATSPPSPSTSVGNQASLASAMILSGYVVALIASLVRLGRTSGGWMLLRAFVALGPIPIFWLWLTRYFRFFMSNICSDCSPPQPIIPDVFQLGGNLLAGAVLPGLILFVVFLALAILRFARTRSATEH